MLNPQQSWDDLPGGIYQTIRDEDGKVIVPDGAPVIHEQYVVEHTRDEDGNWTAKRLNS